MLDREDNDVVRTLIHGVIDEISISAAPLVYGRLRRFDDDRSLEIEPGLAETEESPHEQRAPQPGYGRTNIISDLDQVPGGSRRVAKLHRSKRRNAASISASVAYSRRLA